MGGTADIDRPPAPIASEAYDPLRTAVVRRSSFSLSTMHSDIRAIKASEPELSQQGSTRFNSED
jgi:hypothetical protein